MMGKAMRVEPVMLEITRSLVEKLPEANAIIFFGSLVMAFADRFSDYDVLVLLPSGLEGERRRAIEEELKRGFPSIKLDLVFGSERELLAGLPYEPYWRFWLESGVVTWGERPPVKEYPPLAKGALDSHLNIIKSQIDLAKVLNDPNQSARCCLSALKLLLLVEEALKNEYNSHKVQKALA